jgi:hypothetical protein
LDRNTCVRASSEELCDEAALVWARPGHNRERSPRVSLISLSSRSLIA